MKPIKANAYDLINQVVNSKHVYNVVAKWGDWAEFTLTMDNPTIDVFLKYDLDCDIIRAVLCEMHPVDIYDGDKATVNTFRGSISDMITWIERDHVTFFKSVPKQYAEININSLNSSL